MAGLPSIDLLIMLYISFYKFFILEKFLRIKNYISFNVQT